MATRKLHRLSAKEVEKAKTAGCIADGGGLYLQIGPVGNKSWLFRFMRAGKAREMGLGPLHTVTLADARNRALEARKLLLDDIDPIEARKSRRMAAALKSGRAISFKACAESFIEAHKATWKNEKHRSQWENTLTTYAYPVFGGLSVADIDTGKVLEVLERDKLWHTKPETASRVRGRIEQVLDWATVRSYREGPNPARWKGHLDKTLPARTKVRAVKHHAALPYAELPDFMKSLRAMEGTTPRALELIILTAMRTGEAISAKWEEFDLAQKTWTIPAERMKAKREHTVPLAPAVIALLEKLPKVKENPFLFPGAKANRTISNMSCLAVLERMGRTDLTVHGFRSTFRDWAGEATNFPREVAEMSMAHKVADKVEGAYFRTDLLLKRVKLMEQWADFCLVEHGENVKQITAKVAA